VLGAVCGEHSIDPGLRRRIGRAAQRQGYGAEPKLEQAVPACRLQVVVALGSGPADQLDLAIVQPEARVDLTALRLDRAVVG